MWIQWWHMRLTLVAVAAYVSVLASVPAAAYFAERGKTRHAKLAYPMTYAYRIAN